MNYLIMQRPRLKKHSRPSGYSMKRHLLIAVMLSALAAPILNVALVHADVNDFTITSFQSDQTLSKSDAQGSLHIIEQISVRFTDNNHGIIRAIPNEYNSRPLNFHLNSITSRSGAPTGISQSYADGNVVLKIGDPSRTVTGDQEYTIDYTVRNVISFYSDHDELYWDVNGDQWGQPTTVVKVNLHLPSGLSLSSDVPQCFGGAYSQVQQNCVISQTEDGISATTSNLPPNQTLTYVVGLTKGFFQPETTSEKLRDNATPLLALIALPLAIIAGSFTWWWRNGRDAKGRGVIVPEYNPPKDMTPLQAGTLLDFKTDNRDITATIIDLAVRKYLRIHELVKDRKILKDKVTYELELLNLDKSGLNAYEADLINALFNEQKIGEKTDLGTPSAALQKVATSLRTSVKKDLKQAGYLKPDTSKYGLVLVGSAVVAVVLLAIIGGNSNPNAIGAIVVGAIICTVTISIFWALMAARTSVGVSAKEQLEGLKMYMNVAEKDRIQMLQSPKAAYAVGVGQPKRTVELFEKLLPYAIIMGVEKQWAKQFESMYAAEPSWYSGNVSTFNTVYLASSLNGGFANSINTSFASPSSSSGSGFSGGGFSGGGGGGGW